MMIPMLGYAVAGLLGAAVGYRIGRRRPPHTCCTADTLQRMRSLRCGRAA